MKVNEMIYKLRKEHRLSQMKVAEILHTSQTMYSRYEMGKTMIPTNDVVTLAGYYGVTTDFILGVENMGKYVSKKYLREKWERLKYDMDVILENENSGDKVPEELVNRVKYTICDNMQSIARELMD